MIGPAQFRCRKKICRFTGVEQSEVASIVGMNSDIEAEWIAEGNMPWRTGQTDQISTVAVVEVMLTYQLSLAGCIPRQVRFVVGEAVAAVFYKAFTCVDHSLQVTGLPVDVEDFREDFVRSTNLASELTEGARFASYICRGGEAQDFSVAGDIKDVLDREGVKPPNYVCLRDMACRLTSRLGRPLLSVNLVNQAPPEESTGFWLSTTPKNCPFQAMQTEMKLIHSRKEMTMST